MGATATVELRDLALDIRIGTGPDGAPAPETHVLDITLTIEAAQVLIAEDRMALVFDYDPWRAAVERVVGERRYETQEFLMSRLAAVCAAEPAVRAAEIALHKGPVARGGGSLGLRLSLDADALTALRRA